MLSEFLYNHPRTEIQVTSFKGRMVIGKITAPDGSRINFVADRGSLAESESIAGIIKKANNTRTPEQQDEEMKKINEDVNHWFEVKDYEAVKFINEGAKAMEDNRLSKYLKESKVELYPKFDEDLRSP